MGHAGWESGYHNRTTITVPGPAMKPMNMSPRRRLVPSDARDGDGVGIDDDHVGGGGDRSGKRIRNAGDAKETAVIRCSRRCAGITGQPGSRQNLIAGRPKKSRDGSYLITSQKTGRSRETAGAWLGARCQLCARAESQGPSILTKELAAPLPQTAPALKMAAFAPTDGRASSSPDLRRLA